MNAKVQIEKLIATELDGLMMKKKLIYSVVSFLSIVGSRGGKEAAKKRSSRLMVDDVMRMVWRGSYDDLCVKLEVRMTFCVGIAELSFINVQFKLVMRISSNRYVRSNTESFC